MNRLINHIINSLLAGIVAILPVGGLIITIAYMESTIANSGLSKMPFYFPGLGLIAAVIVIYLIGFLVTTFIGNWIWKRVDSLLNKLPVLGRLYQTLKQILGYGEGKDVLFYEVVLVPSRGTQSDELGLVTNKIVEDNGNTKLVIFVPGVPNPTLGRLIVVDKESVKPLTMPVKDTLMALVSMGKTKIDLKEGNWGST